MENRRLLTLLAGYLLIWSVNAQPITLHGKIVGGDTGLPLENALVEVGEVVTYTNSEGDFVLRVPNHKADELNIMHMGYDVKTEEIKSSRYFISLNEVDPQADEDFGTGSEIMKQVFLRIHYNYELEDQLMMAYYKEDLSAYSKIHHFAEGILEVHIPSNVEKGQPLVRPIKTRVKTLKDLTHGGLYDKSGHASEMIQSGVLAFNTFLSEKNRWDYEYSFIGKEVHRNENVFIVDFKPQGSRGEVQGRLWIDELSFAVIRIEYTPVFETKWDSEKWVEEFQHHNHTYYLMRASFEGHWQEGGVPYVFSSLLVNTEIEANKEYSIKWDDFIPGGDFTFLEESHGNFDEEFWGTYNHILLTDDEKRQLTSN